MRRPRRHDDLGRVRQYLQRHEGRALRRGRRLAQDRLDGGEVLLPRRAHRRRRVRDRGGGQGPERRHGRVRRDRAPLPRRRRDGLRAQQRQLLLDGQPGQAFRQQERRLADLDGGAHAHEDRRHGLVFPGPHDQWRGAHRERRRQRLSPGELARPGGRRAVRARRQRRLRLLQRRRARAASAPARRAGHVLLRPQQKRRIGLSQHVPAPDDEQVQLARARRPERRGLRPEREAERRVVRARRARERHPALLPRRNLRRRLRDRRRIRPVRQGARRAGRAQLLCGRDDALRRRLPAHLRPLARLDPRLLEDDGQPRLRRGSPRDGDGRRDRRRGGALDEGAALRVPQRGDVPQRRRARDRRLGVRRRRLRADGAGDARGRPAAGDRLGRGGRHGADLERGGRRTGDLPERLARHAGADGRRHVRAGGDERDRGRLGRRDEHVGEGRRDGRRDRPAGRAPRVPRASIRLFLGQRGDEAEVAGHARRQGRREVADVARESRAKPVAGGDARKRDLRRVACGGRAGRPGRRLRLEQGRRRRRTVPGHPRRRLRRGLRGRGRQALRHGRIALRPRRLDARHGRHRLSADRRGRLGRGGGGLRGRRIRNGRPAPVWRNLSPPGVDVRPSPE